MNRIIYILFLFTCASYGQMNDIVGDMMITDNMKAEMALRFANPSTTFPDINGNYHDDNNLLNQAAEDFRTAMNNTGVDSGAWDFFDNQNNEIETGLTVTTEPFPNYFNNPHGKPFGSDRNIHAAAIKAYVTDDASLALQVFTAIVERALDDKLDASNGGSERAAGEPTRTNTTFGTTARFNYNPQHGYATYTGNPFFISATKMEGYLTAYGMVKDLIKNDSFYINYHEYVNYWFKDWAEFLYANVEAKTQYWIASNWRSFANDSFLRPTLISNGFRSLFDSNGNVTHRVTDGQGQGINNRTWDIVSYLGAFGLYFNDHFYTDYHYDFFRLTMYVAVYPDNIFHEWYRNNDGGGSANGAHYNYNNYTHMTVGAHQHEVAVAKGYLSINEKGKYWDFSTTIGSDELYASNYAATRTSGGPKSLLNVLKKHGEFYRTPANGGVKGIYYQPNNVAINTDGVTTILPYHFARLYYPDDVDLENLSEMATGVGYPPNQPNAAANGVSPNTMGVSWNKGAMVGGLTLAGEQSEPYSTSTTRPDPEPEPTTYKSGDPMYFLKWINN